MAKRKYVRKSRGILKKFFTSVRESVYQMLLIAVAIMGTMHYIGYNSDKKIAVEIDKQNPLTENQVRRLVIDLLRDRLIVQEKGKQTKVHTGVRKAEFTELKDGKIEMNIPTKGFTIEPGFAVGMGDGLRIGPDLQFAYWKRWGAVAGITFPVQQRALSRVRGHLALSWSPYWHWTPNTSVYVGADTNKTPTIGFRTRF